MGQPLELGRTLLVAGEIERRAKQKRTARSMLQDALEIFERIGAPLWVERAAGCSSGSEAVPGRPAS